MKKLFSILLALVCATAAFADSEITGIFNNANNGTTSATIFVEPASEYANITDLGWKLDAGVTTGIIVFRPGDIQYTCTSATSGSGTVAWFSNAGTAVAVGEYIIVHDESLGDFYLRQVIAATTTSVTVSESIPVALTTSDKVWSVEGSFARPIAIVNSQTAAQAVSIWLPKLKPTAITIDGNTTACRISVSGIRTNYR